MCRILEIKQTVISCALHSPSQRSVRSGQQSKHVCDNTMYITMCYTTSPMSSRVYRFQQMLDTSEQLSRVNGPEGKRIELLIISPICYSFQYSHYNRKYGINGMNCILHIDFNPVFHMNSAPIH